MKRHASAKDSFMDTEGGRIAYFTFFVSPFTTVSMMFYRVITFAYRLAIRPICHVTTTTTNKTFTVWNAFLDIF
ncbi:hypothetical protein [Burkholderia sola]|uniref:hypothetical protein n=1 Tax=Burkholderia sola TaxID=2843302 RepID=UPI0023DDC2FE|nr:hypothetical protein [Burkholderia sola]MDF3080083.1 hypothetical protein [Burkholderia sola]